MVKKNAGPVDRSLGSVVAIVTNPFYVFKMQF